MEYPHISQVLTSLPITANSLMGLQFLIERRWLKGASRFVRDDCIRNTRTVAVLIRNARDETRCEYGRTVVG